MIDCNDIQRRLKLLIEDRNFFFKGTTRSEADKYLKSKNIFSGLSVQEIERLEKKLGRDFPEDFKKYLSVFGKSCGDLFCCGQDIEPSKILDYQEWAMILIKKQNIASFLTDNSIVFLFHQGYSFYFFDKQGEDSVVYLYVEGDSKPQRKFSNFAELLERELQHLEKINNDWKESGGYFISINNGIQRLEWPAKDSGVIPRAVGDNFIEEKEKTFASNTSKEGRLWWQKLFGLK